MKQQKFKIPSLIALMLITGSLFISSCGEEDPTASVSINETGSDLGGDVTGDGGSTVRSYKWNNSLRTIDYNMDITAAKGGSFTLSVADADGTSVLNQTLVVGQGDDSKSGVSATGTSGEWTITVTLTDFNGDGSFSISPGN
ncbi:MAG: hypothetical protein RLO17_15825 [Cyclobacteriaceae bacterium]